MLDNSHAPDYGVPAGTFNVIEYHLDTTYQTAWGNARHNYYRSGGGVPDCWWDGALSCYGAYTNYEQMYTWYKQQYDARRAVATNVQVKIGGETIDEGAHLYRVTVRVCMESGGSTTAVRIYVVQVLDDWPVSPNYSRNTFVQAGDPYVDVTLYPAGDCATVVRDFTFNDVTNFPSWTNRNKIKIIAWAQQQSGKQIYNAAEMRWPFSPLPPLGDMNCDYLVNNQDIDGFLQALFDAAGYIADHDGDPYPYCDILNGDFNHDGAVNNLDIDWFIDVLFGG